MPLPADPFEGLALSDSPVVINPSSAIESPAGHIDFYGYHTVASGWLFAGWLLEPNPSAGLFQKILVSFDNESIATSASAVFFAASGPSSDRVGFMILVRSIDENKGPLAALRIVDQDSARILHSLPAALLPEGKLQSRLKLLVDLVDDPKQIRAMELLLREGKVNEGHGFAEFFGYHPEAGGWFVGGWSSHGWPANQMPTVASIAFDDGEVSGPRLPLSMKGITYLTARSAWFSLSMRRSRHGERCNLSRLKRVTGKRNFGLFKIFRNFAREIWRPV